MLDLAPCQTERAVSYTHLPGYHLNKSHWNTVLLDESIPEIEIKKMIIHSYEQVVAGLPKSLRERLARETWPRA